MPAGVVDAAAKGVRLERHAAGAAVLLRRAAGAKQLVSASSHLLFCAGLGGLVRGHRVGARGAAQRHAAAGQGPAAARVAWGGGARRRHQ